MKTAKLEELKSKVFDAYLLRLESGSLAKLRNDLSRATTVSQVREIMEQLRYSEEAAEEAEY